MKITDIRIRKTFTEGNLNAIVSLTIDDCLALHDVKIISGAGEPLWQCPQDRAMAVYTVTLSTPSAHSSEMSLKPKSSMLTSSICSLTAL